MNQPRVSTDGNGFPDDISEAGRQRTHRRRLRIAAKMERLSIDERPLIQRLSEIGVCVTSIEDLLARYPVLPEPAVQCLLEALKTCSEPVNQEWILRALCNAENRFDGREVVKCLRSTSDETVRFVALIVIAMKKPACIEAWLQMAEQDSDLRERLRRLAGP